MYEVVDQHDRVIEQTNVLTYAVQAAMDYVLLGPHALEEAVHRNDVARFGHKTITNESSGERVEVQATHDPPSDQRPERGRHFGM